MSTAARTPRLTAVPRSEERVTPLELFFDLVFVLALTQCTALMAEHATWGELARGLLVLALMWWSWVGYAWLGNVVPWCQIVGMPRRSQAAKNGQTLLSVGSKCW